MVEPCGYDTCLKGNKASLPGEAAGFLKKHINPLGIDYKERSNHDITLAKLGGFVKKSLCHRILGFIFLNFVSSKELKSDRQKMFDAGSPFILPHLIFSEVGEGIRKEATFPGQGFLCGWKNKRNIKPAA